MSAFAQPIMPVSAQRHHLLDTRLRVFARALPRLAAGEVRVLDRAREAVRRLREVLPVLQLEAPAAGRLVDRLRKVGRRLHAAGQFERLLADVVTLEETEPRSRAALARLHADVQRLAREAHADLNRRRVGHDVRRLSEKLANLVSDLRASGTTARQLRAMRWAARARVSRRASQLKAAIVAAGSVYLPGRLDDVRTGVRKLRYGAEVAAGVGVGLEAREAASLARLQTLLEKLDDTQALIDRARRVQGSLATPDLKAWRDLDVVVVILENRCRALHARYVRERGALSELCERWAGLAPAEGSRSKRKVG